MKRSCKQNAKRPVSKNYQEEEARNTPTVWSFTQEMVRKPVCIILIVIDPPLNKTYEQEEEKDIEKMF